MIFPMDMSGSIQHIQPESLTVIKTGGALVSSVEALMHSAANILSAENPVVVCGGGKEIDDLCSRLGIQVRKKDGLRITDAQTAVAVEMSLAHTSSNLSLALRSMGRRALPLPAYALPSLASRSADPELQNVGEIVHVETGLLLSLLCQGTVPVIYPVACSDTCQRLNVNADELASSVAAALRARRLFFMTDVPGVMDGNGVLRKLTAEEARRMLEEGRVSGGMIPKLRAAERALLAGVGKVVVADGREEWKRVFMEDVRIGTEIQK